MNSFMKVFGFFIYNWRKVRDRLLSTYLQHYYYQRIGKIGKGVRFNGISKITGLKKVEIEDNVHIGNNAYLRGEGGLFIGANTHISRNLVVYTHNHNYQGNALPYDNTFLFKKVIIERNVWIGMNVTILPGAHIKEGAIIGAGSVIAGTVEPLAIMGASLAKKIKSRDQSHYNRLNEKGQFGGPSGVPIKS
ncbi:MAG: acyltransferase [Calditrichia bacterium]